MRDKDKQSPDQGIQEVSESFRKHIMDAVGLSKEDKANFLIDLKALFNAQQASLDEMTADIESKFGDLQQRLRLLESSAQPKRLEEPPVPKRKPGSKQYQDAFRRIRVVANIPESLMELFERDRERRGKNISQMFEYILHNYYREHPVK